VPGEYGKGERVRLYSADPAEDRGDSTAEITSTVLSAAPNRWAKRLTGAKAMLTPGSTAQVGDLALWDVEPARVRGSILHARSCDDLGGGLAILWALDQLVAQQPDA